MKQIAKSLESQHGASLITVLLLLLIMTLLGLAVLRGTLLEERMSANMYDRSLAFQQAESALREAEEQVRNAVLAGGNGWVIGIKCGNDPASGGLSGIDEAKCGVMPLNIFSSGASCAGGGLVGDCWFNATDQLGAANKSAGAPQYYVQYLGLRDSHDELGLGSSAASNQYGGGGGVVQEAMYRISARSHDPAVNRDRAVVVLQANVVAK